MIAEPIYTGENFYSTVKYLIALSKISALISSSAKYNSSISASKSAKVSINSILFSSTKSLYFSGISISYKISPEAPPNK